jgi:hypothetical protein
MTHALTRSDLEKVRCSNPDCAGDHSVIFLHPHCHPEASTWASFNKNTGALTLECAECETLVASVLVAHAS